MEQQGRPEEQLSFRSLRQKVRGAVTLCIGALCSCYLGATTSISTAPREHAGGDLGSATEQHQTDRAQYSANSPQRNSREPRPYSSSTLPGGLPCLIRLKELGVSFRSLPPREGVLTPVQLTGELAGITYRALGRRALVCDCRLALALFHAGHLFQELGVREVFFSSAYSYRTMASGKLSQHAMGLAIDIHRLRVGDELLTVEDHFIRGLLGTASTCPPGQPILNQLACLLKTNAYFDWVLTPDTDQAHHNHFHLDIYCLYRRRFVAENVPPPAITE